MKQIKCVVVGDVGVGKACLWRFYTANASSGNDFIVWDHYQANFIVEDRPVILELWGPYSQGDDWALRSQSPQETDIFVTCFSLVCPESLRNVGRFWVPELKHSSPDASYILVGLKSDVRDKLAANQSERGGLGTEPILTSLGEDMRAAVRATAYIECCAMTGANVASVFETAVDTALHPGASGSPSESMAGEDNCRGLR
jgi:small GTP-binding protein